ncbi:hypothetical protein CARUB_v10019040mg [Capsella rubella]|uniref:FBD domain-containing protein n=1 Tax=Capsella rubella TaxID=81985 RepID=R0FS81_9BRAS|nr:hypothetical protein CARUB_v10019040mg [Capsella rubella]
MLPKLMFDSYYHSLKGGTFSKNVRKTMLSHKDPFLQSLHFKLVLQVQPVKWVRTPARLYSFEKLETLKLKYLVLMGVPSSVCLKSLRTLHLYYVDFSDKESFVNLLAGCPNLENLMVRRYPYNNVGAFTIAVPSLQRLTIYDYSKARGGYVINNVTTLVEAHIIDVSDINIENLLGSLTSVRRLILDLSPLKAKFPTGSIFHQLQLGWREGSPWNQPKNVPECLLFHLDTFMLEGYYKWKRDEIEVAKYLLSNKNRLKRAIFSYEFVDDPKEKAELVEDLNSVVWASKSCQLLVK